MPGATAIAAAVEDAVAQAAVTLRPDVLSALRRAYDSEPSARGRAVLGQLLENAEIAARDRVPLCQDTGTVWVWVELGADECAPVGLQAEIDRAVARAYSDNGLRMSVVRDALFDRGNTGDNTPAFLDVTLRRGSGATVHVMLKGGGSDNASVVAMLDPSAGADGVAEIVERTVEAKASGACPPLIVGVGVGGTFDSVAKLAKRALLLPVDERSLDPRVRAFEERLLGVVNATGVGPAGLGGVTTALGVRVISAPCHIAALPAAVNLGCCAMRSVTLEVA